MRKIISILVALGLVLAMSTMAVPTTGAACTATVTASVPPFCASGTDTYNIAIAASPVTLLPGNDLLSVTFGDGTSLAAVVAAGVTVNTHAVAAVVKSGTHIEFAVPAAAGTILAGAPIAIVIAGVVNPAVPGAYALDLNYKLSCCDAVVFDCADYTVVPAGSTYDFIWDSNPTYPGVAVGFVPPFKACGQEGFPGLNITTVTNPTGVWANAFNLTLEPTLIGCAGPCADNVTVTMNLTAAPAGSNVTISLNSTVYHLLPLDEIVVGNYTLGANTTIVWENFIHFDTVGMYQICLEAVCPAGALICPECSAEATIVAEECFDIEVHQWKDADKITLDEKWNLISLPLVPFDTDIDAILAALPAAGLANLISIWNYDGCTGEWFIYGNGHDTLATLEDGKGYWVRMTYPMAGTYDLWVWGTEKPMPPLAPAEYPICEGWNMFGFTSMTSMAVGGAGNYLWNWGTPDPVIYEWIAGDWTVQGWNLVAFPAGNLNPGQGYWGAFPADGAIYVP